jgi:hypothetical protein
MTEPTYKIYIGQGTKREPAEKRVSVVNVTDGYVYVYVSKKNFFPILRFCLYTSFIFAVADSSSNNIPSTDKMCEQ